LRYDGPVSRRSAARETHLGGSVTREIRWTSLEGGGVEQLAFSSDAKGSVAESVVIGQRDGRGFGLAYRVVCDARWRARQVALRVMGGGALELHSDGAGHWRDGGGAPLPELDGCIDVDIAATPYTNTLPIRRLQLARGERRELDVAFISTPDLQPVRARQAYVCVEPDRLYRYEGQSGRFVAHLPVDQDGLVIDYETLFRRLRAA
jgi:uncharacterized protein